jgi:hypothetical protein
MRRWVSEPGPRFVRPSRLAPLAPQDEAGRFPPSARLAVAVAARRPWSPSSVPHPEVLGQRLSLEGRTTADPMHATTSPIRRGRTATAPAGAGRVRCGGLERSDAEHLRSQSLTRNVLASPTAMRSPTHHAVAPLKLRRGPPSRRLCRREGSCARLAAGLTANASALDQRCDLSGRGAVSLSAEGREGGPREAWWVGRPRCTGPLAAPSVGFADSSPASRVSNQRPFWIRHRFLPRETGEGDRHSSRACPT